MGTDVTFTANGGTEKGYLALPASGKGHGMIVIQEWWGLNDQVKGVADMIAREGFVALAPDFYHGKGAKIGEPDQAQKLMMEFFQANDAAKTARGAAEYLTSHAALTSKKVGTVKVTVKARNAGAADGSVKVAVHNAKGKVVAQVKATKLKNGTAVVKLPKLAKGKYQLAVTFGGDSNVKGSSKTTSLKVG